MGARASFESMFILPIFVMRVFYHIEFGLYNENMKIQNLAVADGAFLVCNSKLCFIWLVLGSDAVSVSVQD